MDLLKHASKQIIYLFQEFLEGKLIHLSEIKKGFIIILKKSITNHFLSAIVPIKQVKLRKFNVFIKIFKENFINYQHNSKSFEVHI
jgi:hypothetical protein